MSSEESSRKTGKMPEVVKPKRASEEILSEKWDLCLSNAIVMAGLGVGVGVVGSVILFRRRAWPVFTGLGFGLGQAYNDCDRRR